MSEMIRATVKVGQHQRERRFSPSTPKRVITAWKERETAKLKKRYPASAPAYTRTAGLFAADIDRVLPLIKHLTTWTDVRTSLRAWLPFIGRKTRDAVTKADVLTARGAWKELGVANRTINNRVSALRQLYKILEDDKEAWTPADGIDWLKPPKVPKQLVPVEVVNRVCDALMTRHQAYREGVRTGRGRPGGQHAEKDRARLMVMAATGKRPAEVGAARPEDVDLERRVWQDRTAKGGDSPGVYLNEEMLIAWWEFISADAWGDFSADGHFARRLHNAGWPAGLKPYNVRHSAWTAASERGIDLADIQVGAGHKRIETTRKHYVAVLGSRMQTLSETIDKRFGWTPRLVKKEDTA